MYKYFLLIFLIFSETVYAKYKNTDGEAIDKSIKDLIRWQRNQSKPILASIDLSEEWKNIDLHNDDNYLIWIGHSTFLIKKNGLTTLTDPVFSERASPFKRLGPKRLIPPSLMINDLPSIDVVTISHNHYDHLDIRSLKKISEKSETINAKNFLKFTELKGEEVEIFIRTGGEKRVSNFLLPNIGYSELFFSDKLWPDFSAEDFNTVLDDFKTRQRRFGK